MLCLLCLAGSVLLPQTGRTEQGERQLPVHLRADRIDIDQKKQLSLYRGNVVLTQGTLRLTAARAEAQARTNVLERIDATGKPATFRLRPEGQLDFIEGKADRILYHAMDQKLDLFDHVEIRRGRDLYQGATLHYDVTAERIIGEGNATQRVYLALVPHTGTLTQPDSSP